MSIDWLNIEELIDQHESLSEQRDRANQQVSDDPENRSAWLELLDALDQLAEKNPGENYADQGWSAANRASHSFEDDAHIRGWCARFALRSGDISLALFEAAEALKADPREVLARIVRAQVFMQAGRFQEALGDLDLAEGDINARHGTEARRSYDERLGNELTRLRILCLARTHRYQEALDIQHNRYKEEPDEVQVIIDYAELLEMTGSLEHSKDVLSEALIRNPSSIELLRHVSARHYDRREFSQAIELADEVLELNPQHLETWHFRAQCHLQRKQFQQALDDHSMIAELSKTIPLDASFIAACYVGMGKQQEALDALKAGIKDPRNPMDRVLDLRKQLSELTARMTGGASKNLGPNDPCWCGSGKKLKKCHRVAG